MKGTLRTERLFEDTAGEMFLECEDSARRGDVDEESGKTGPWNFGQLAVDHVTVFFVLTSGLPRI